MIVCLAPVQLEVRTCVCVYLLGSFIGKYFFIKFSMLGIKDGSKRSKDRTWCNDTSDWNTSSLQELSDTASNRDKNRSKL